MKKLLTLLTLSALIFSSAATATAAEKPEGANKPAEAPGGAPQKVAGEQLKTMPMYVRVDLIDPATRTFSLKRKDGVIIKHVVPAEAEIKQGPAAAKLEDIKIGDYVSGSRRKVSETEYTVVKITKFGPPTQKQ